MRRLLSRIPRSILAMRARTGARCRPQGDLRRRSGVLRPSRRQRAPLHPSGHCDDHCPLCRSGSGARCAEASRSSGAGRRRLPARSRARTGAPSLEFSEGVEPRFSGVTVTAAGGGSVPLGQTKVRSGPPRGVGHADRQVVLARRLHRPLASSFGRLPSHARNLSVHRPMNDSPEPHVFERTTEQTETRFSS